jgi:signal transduction histidine kinase
VARSDAGTFKLKPEQADLRETVQRSVESFLPQAAQAGIRLEASLPDGPVSSRLDRQRIGQVLGNLISNALKFTASGGLVRVSLRGEEGHARCEVIDSGCGIAPEDLPRLFQRFTQLEEGERKGGTGLGLYISKLIVEAHGGAIGVNSVPGQGSVFWFELPRVPGDISSLAA